MTTLYISSNVWYTSMNNYNNYCASWTNMWHVLYKCTYVTYPRPHCGYISNTCTHNVTFHSCCACSNTWHIVLTEKCTTYSRQPVIRIEYVTESLSMYASCQMHGIHVCTTTVYFQLKSWHNSRQLCASRQVRDKLPNYGLYHQHPSCISKSSNIYNYQS